MTNPPLIIRLLLVLLVIPAAMWDLRYRRVPNWLTLAGILLGIGVNTVIFRDSASGRLAGLWMSLEGIGVAFLIYFPLYLLRGMGAGDVKLMAAVGAIVGPANWLGVLLLTSVFGAAAAVILVSRKGRIGKTARNIWLILISIRYRHAPYEASPELDVKSDRGIRLPHAVVIAFGCLGFLGAAAIWAPR